MFHDGCFLETKVGERIAEALRFAAHERLAREAGQVERRAPAGEAPLTRWLRTLASGVGFGVLEGR